MSQEGDGWVGAWAIVTKNNGRTIAGRFEGYFKTHAGRTLRLLCDWGSCDIPESLVVKTHFS